jgi:Transglycosylase SLT domain
MLRRQSPGKLAVGLGAVVLLIAVLVATLSGGASQPPLPLPGIGRPARSGDPFAYSANRAGDFEARAVAGNDNVLYLKSPGGVLVTAARVARYRTMIDAATAGTGIDPNILEAMVFLESAGNPNAIAGVDPAAAAGLTQIEAQTGQSLLGMHINLQRSRALTAQIDTAYALGRPARVASLQAQRAKIDDRFNPPKALAATVRYLKLAEQHFGRSDLAVESYHMGIGNLADVLGAYDGGRPVPYVQLFFDTAPDHNGSAYALLHSFNDDSLLYYWRVLAAASIMHMYRTDRGALAARAALETGAASNALVLHPPSSTQSFDNPAALRDGYARHAVLPLPANPGALGLAYDPSMGALAAGVHEPAALYRGLRPPALDLLIELAARVRAISGTRAPLVVSSTVTDQKYAALNGIQAVPLSSTGYSFAIERHYASSSQAQAFQAMLDLLQSLDLIAWVRDTTTIDITVSSDADRVLLNGP